jgi:vesicle coat complex subunit
MTGLHEHCQCDNCSGVDCGQDNPEEWEAEQNVIQKKRDDELRKTLREYISKTVEGCECPYDNEDTLDDAGMNSKRCLSARSCALCIFDHAVESIGITEQP